MAHMRTRGPGAAGLLQVQEVPDCGHAPALNVPQQLAWVTDFLDSAEQTSPPHAG